MTSFVSEFIAECFNVSEKIEIAITRIKRTGIMIFEVASIPLFTPLKTIKETAKRKITNNKIGSH